MPLVFTGVAADPIEAPSRACRRSALPKRSQLAEIETVSQSKETGESETAQVGFVIGTAIVAISQNPVIEIGVATPHHACIRNFLRSGSSREFVASEASFGRTVVVTNATVKPGRLITNSFQNKRMLASGTTRTPGTS
jgi:hypothetical protein